MVLILKILLFAGLAFMLLQLQIWLTRLGPIPELDGPRGYLKSFGDQTTAAAILFYYLGKVAFGVNYAAAWSVVVLMLAFLGTHSIMEWS